MSFTVVIPARYASTRLPGKPLALIAGKPMIQHVYERARESGAQRIIIATDDQQVYDCAQSFNAEVCMTSVNHASGTDRIAQVAQDYALHDDDIIVNLQGDEPCMSPLLITQVAELLSASHSAVMSTICRPLVAVDRDNPNCVKVVFDVNHHALYFSRAAIPWSDSETPRYQHLGLYAYRVGFLKTFIKLRPSPLEIAERLEQLRAIYYGYSIKVAVTTLPHVTGVDTLEDLERVNRQLIA